MFNKIKKLYQRIKYRKQLKQGFKLLGDHKSEFVLVDGKAFITNGVDPMVKIDLTKGTGTQLKGKTQYITTYKYKVTANNALRTNDSNQEG